MKVPIRSGDSGVWERMIARYLTASKVPVVWNGSRRAFEGLHGFTIKRIAPMRARYDTSQSMRGLPEVFRANKEVPNYIVIVTNAHYGDNLEDSLVVLRLGDFTPMLATFINNDRERYLRAANDHG